MLNLFGRTFRNPVQYPPAFPGLPISGCRSAHSATARVFSHSLHQLNYARNEELYTAEEEAEIREFLDRDLLADTQGGGNALSRVPDGENLPPRHTHPSEYRRVKKLARSERAHAETVRVSAESIQQGEDVPTTRASATSPHLKPTSEDEMSTDWEDVSGENATSRPATHPTHYPKKKPRPKLLPKPKPKPSKPLSLEALKIPPKPPYQPYNHLRRFPYTAITLTVDPLGLPPSINSLLFSMGFRYRSQTLYRRRSSKLRLGLRRLGEFVSVEFLTEEEAGKRRAEKRTSLAKEYEARLKTQMAYHTQRTQDGTTADGEG